jgi:hypothetical protein
MWNLDFKKKREIIKEKRYSWVPSKRRNDDKRR